MTLTIGTRVKMKHAGHLGTIEAVLVERYLYIVRWDSGLTTRAQHHELEAL